MKQFIIIILGISAAAYAQLEQQYLHGNGDYQHTTKIYPTQDECVRLIEQPNINYNKPTPQKNCQKDPERCNCLNHQEAGFLIEQDYDRRSAVKVYEREEKGEKWRQNSDYDGYHWVADPEAGSPNFYQNSPKKDGYGGEYYYLKNQDTGNPEGGAPQPYNDQGYWPRN